MADPLVLRLGDNEVHIHESQRHVTTFLPGGFRVEAAPNHGPADVARAYALGHGGDTWEMTKWHEACHTFLAVREGRPCSPTLLAMGGGAAYPRALQGLEEMAVCRFQAFVMGAGGSCDDRWAGLAMELRGLMGARDGGS